jgi:hypothetical protein
MSRNHLLRAALWIGGLCGVLLPMHQCVGDSALASNAHEPEKSGVADSPAKIRLRLPSGAWKA